MHKRINHICFYGNGFTVSHIACKLFYALLSNKSVTCTFRSLSSIPAVKVQSLNNCYETIIIIQFLIVTWKVNTARLLIPTSAWFFCIAWHLFFCCRPRFQYSRGNRKSTHSRRQWDICYQNYRGRGSRTGWQASHGGQAHCSE